MDQNGGLNLLHRRSPSSDCFLDMFSPKIPSVADAGDDFDDDYFFWTGDFAELNRKTVQKKLGIRSSGKSGILAALPEIEQNPTIRDRQVHRKPSILSSQAELADFEQNRTLRDLSVHRISSISSSKGELADFEENRSLRDLQVHRRPSISSSPRLSLKIRSSIPKHLQNTQTTMFSQSAPINVPMKSKVRSRNGDIADMDYDDESEEEEMLPPHEIVAREKKTTFSVLEGIGRTLKGRDLRQVRNAVWRQTGFLD